MTGYVHVPEVNLWAPYYYEDNVLTIYEKNSFDADSTSIQTTPKIELKSDWPYIVGNISNKGGLIVFFVDRIPFKENFFPNQPHSIFIGSSSIVNVLYYLLLEGTETLFDNTYYYCEELNHFFSTNYGIDQTFNIGDTNFNSMVAIKKVEQSKKEFKFVFRGVDISASFFVGYIHHTQSKTPIDLKSGLRLSFPETNDINFIVSLSNVVKDFFMFICYRSNIVFEDIEIHQKIKSHLKPDRMHSIKNYLHESKSDNVKKEIPKNISKTIPYSFVEDHLSSLFNFIADNKLYTEHIPISKRNGFTIGRMILMTAAFEWNANKFLDVEPISKNRSAVVKDVLDELTNGYPEKMGYNRKKRENLDFIVSTIKDMQISLSVKVKYALEKYKIVIYPFAEALYTLNNHAFDFDVVKKDMSSRIEYHRNAFAHGNIEKEVYSEIILDLLILQWLTYCVVLDQCGYNQKDIITIVDKIFDRHLYLDDYFRKNGLIDLQESATSVE